MRKLLDGNKFSHNAWDDVEMTEDELNYANIKLEEDKKYIDTQKFTLESKYWNQFYSYHKDNFFRNRKYISKDISINDFNKVLELGCGVGDSLYECNFENEIIGYDYSEMAINICKTKYPKGRFFVRDITKKESFTDFNVDLSLLIFSLSAIHPKFHLNIFLNLSKSMKKGGLIYFRDYGYMDMVQLRYKPEQVVDENFYRRPDGTFTYFFSIEYLKSLIKKTDLSIVELKENKKLLTNRKRMLTMHRIQIMGIFQK